MKYEKIVRAKFIERNNRFVATVAPADEDRTGIDGSKPVNVHVKNTGRCKELLVPGSTVYLEDFEGRMGSRHMRYSLIAVEKKVGVRGEGSLLINMDSQAPNKVVQEALEAGRITLPGMNSRLTLIRPETRFGDSRFDFYI